MNKLSHGIHAALGLLLLITGAWAPGPVPPANASPPAATHEPDLQAFQLVAPGSGWVLLDQRLHWTDDGGQRWRDLTPAALGSDHIAAARFADTTHGWLVTLSAGVDPAYRLFRTTNGGRTWQSLPLDLFAPGDVSALSSAVFLEFIDARTGWMVVKQATSSAFNVGTLFGTTDAGNTWTRLTIPGGVPVHFTSTLEGWLDTGPPENAHYTTHDGGATWELQDSPPPMTPFEADGLSEISLATPEAGWARSAQGNCEAGTCELVTQLLQTTDGGQTWAPVTLPTGDAAIQKTFTPPASAAAVDTAESQFGLAFNFAGHGFDACTLPSVANMQTWLNDSPYDVWNLYIGGGSVAGCGQLTASYVRQLAHQGWLFIPTWVGPQPPCSNIGSRKFSADLATAYQQGIIEAYLALNRAEVLGLLRPGQAGTIIYYDIESYPNQTGCRAAAKSFISGWTATLRANGSRSGVYGSPCSSYISDLAAISNVPDAVWLAVWRLPPQFDPSASVMNVSCISNTLWSQNQRLRQYAGDHNENYSGVGFNIDSNVIAGPVATAYGGCEPNANQAAFFVHVNYGGLCVVTNIGDYATYDSLGAFRDKISSVTVGANVKVRLCQDVGYQGVCQDFGVSDGDLSNDAVGNDTVSSLKVYLRPALPLRVRLPLVANDTPHVAVGLPNGGYESGTAGWDTSSARGMNVIVPNNVLQAGSVAPHSGSWAVWMGGVHTETVTLRQTVGVPAGAPNLTYWRWIKSSETGCYYDVASVWVNDSVVDSFGLCGQSGGWSKRMLSLHAYAGQTVALRFQVTTDSSLISSLFLDDLVFESGP